MGVPAGDEARAGEVRSGQVRSGNRVDVGKCVANGDLRVVKNPKTWNFGVREVLAKFCKGLSKTRVGFLKFLF